MDELVPKLLGLGEIQKVLQNLLREGISIRDLLTILETLADYAPTTRDTDILTEYVRQSLKRAISTKYFPSHETTSVLTLDPKIEQEVMGSVKQTETGAFLNLDPARSKAILNAVGEEIKKAGKHGKDPHYHDITDRKNVFQAADRRLLSGSGRSVLQRSRIECGITVCGYGHSLRY